MLRPIFSIKKRRDYLDDSDTVAELKQQKPKKWEIQTVKTPCQKRGRGRPRGSKKVQL